MSDIDGGDTRKVAHLQRNQLARIGEGILNFLQNEEGACIMVRKHLHSYQVTLRSGTCHEVNGHAPTLEDAISYAIHNHICDTWKGEHEVSLKTKTKVRY